MQHKKDLKYHTAWRRRNAPIIKGDGVFGAHVTMNPYVIQKDNDIYLFYAGDTEEGYRNIRLVIFKDGDLSNPEYKGIVINNGEWGSFDGYWCVIPCVIRVGEKWHLYYSGNSGMGEGLGAFPGIGLATSDDLIHWTKYENNPVLPPSGVLGTGDTVGIGGGGLNMMLDGTIRWYYTGCPTVGPEHFLDQQKHICLAESKDGINWERKGPVISREPDRDYRDIACAGACGPCVYEDGLYKLYYPCIGTRWGFYSICYSESEDGINWNIGEEYGDELAFGPRTRHLDISAGYTEWDNEIVEYPCVFEKDGKKYMFYTGNGYGYDSGIGLAEACNSRVYARGTSVFAMYNGERYDLNIAVTVNGEALPESKWATPDSDCNTWRESVINGVRVRIIITHTLDGLRVFCTVMSEGTAADVEAKIDFGALASVSDKLSVIEHETKYVTMDVKLD